MRRNLELKARCADLAVAARAVEKLGAKLAGQFEQIDTYFRIAAGRLKLRVQTDRPAELIWYHRSNSPETRESSYEITTIPDPGRLREMLAGALGLRGEVRKRRTLYLWHNVRIHLDDVQTLGTFLEFEAVIESDTDCAGSQEKIARLTDALSIQPGDFISVSYSDLPNLSPLREGDDLIPERDAPDDNQRA